MKELDPTTSFLERVKMGNIASRRDIREFAGEQSRVLDKLTIEVSVEKGKVSEKKRVELAAKASLGAVRRIGEEIHQQALRAKKNKDNKRFSLLFDFSAGILFICANLEAASTIGVFPGRQFLLEGMNELVHPEKREDSQELIRGTTEKAMGELTATKKLLDKDPTGFRAIDESLRRLLAQGSSWALSAHLVNAGAISAVKLYKRIYQQAAAQFSS